MSSSESAIAQSKEDALARPQRLQVLLALLVLRANIYWDHTEGEHGVVLLNPHSYTILMALLEMKKLMYPEKHDH